MWYGRRCSSAAAQRQIAVRVWHCTQIIYKAQVLTFERRHSEESQALTDTDDADTRSSLDQREPHVNPCKSGAWTCLGYNRATLQENYKSMSYLYSAFRVWGGGFAATYGMILLVLGQLGVSTNWSWTCVSQKQQNKPPSLRKYTNFNNLATATTVASCYCQLLSNSRLLQILLHCGKYCNIYHY